MSCSGADFLLEAEEREEVEVFWDILEVIWSA